MYRIRGLFYAEFDNTVGPKIFFQAPEGFICADDFDDISEYMITKPDLCGKIVTVVHPSMRLLVEEGDDSETPAPVGPVDASAAPISGDASAGAEPVTIKACSERTHTYPIKIINFPVGLQHERYPRNTLLFSVGFALDPDADTRPYEPVLRKLGLLLYSMEIEGEFLFRVEKKAQLASMLPMILAGLNARGECFVPADSVDTIALKLFPVLPHPSLVRDHNVPVRLRDMDVMVGSGDDSGWDLCMRTVLPHIDGVQCVRAISEAADVELPLVKRVVQHLLYYGCIALVDIFQYTNIYSTQPRVQLLLRSEELRTACATYIHQDTSGLVLPRVFPSSIALAAAPHAPRHTRDIPDRLFRLYSAFGAGSRMCDVCAQCDTAGMEIDDRKFATFGILHGFLRRVQKYPVPKAGSGSSSSIGGGGGGGVGVERSVAPGSSSAPHGGGPLLPHVLALLDGTRTLEEICCRLHCSQSQIEAAIDLHGGFVYVLK